MILYKDKSFETQAVCPLNDGKHSCSTTCALACSLKILFPNDETVHKGKYVCSLGKVGNQFCLLYSKEYEE